MPPGDPAWEMLTAFRDWQLLGLVPCGARTLGEAPAFVVDGFRALAEVDEQLDESAETKRRQGETEMLMALVGAKRR